MDQKVAIAWYTISYQREEKIIVDGARKLAPQAGTFFRGENRRFRKNQLHTMVSLESFRSVSASRDVAEGFIDAEKPSQLLIIKAKTARDISELSEGQSDHGVIEHKLLLLPGTKLRIDSIYPDKITFFNEETQTDETIPIQVVELSEVSP